MGLMSNLLKVAKKLENRSALIKVASRVSQRLPVRAIDAVHALIAEAGSRRGGRRGGSSWHQKTPTGAEFRMEQKNLGREAALRILYGMDAGGEEDPNKFIELFWDPIDPLAPEGANPNQNIDYSARSISQQIVQGVLGSKEALDQVINNASIAGSRLSRIDRNLIRLAIWELWQATGKLPSPEEAKKAAELRQEGHKPAATPETKKIIDQIVELAKTYGSGSETYGYINGVLSTVALAIEPKGPLPEEHEELFPEEIPTGEKPAVVQQEEM